MKQKIQTLLTQLNHGLVEREATLKTALLTVLSGENLVLIGPPGTGKSLIARRIAESFAHSKSNSYFEYLLTKFSTPEEIFGPLSITALKADRFSRNTAGYLPTVKIAFLDEIFKASSSILNALLTILNERIYHNGSEPQRVPMQALIAASNELPTDQEELSALYDRFLVRGFVDYVSQDNLLRLFENAGPMPTLTQLTATELESIKNAAESVTIPPEIVKAVQRIWIQHKETFKEDRRESLSDRRLKKVINLLCVSAATNGRNEVDLSDVFLLKDCLWNHQDNALKVRDLILNTLQLSHGAAIYWERNTDFSQQSHNLKLSNTFEVKILDIGDYDEVKVIELLIKPGDVIEKGQSLITVESDKVSIEIPATEGGRVKEIKVKIDDKLSKGDVILILEVKAAASTPTLLTKTSAKLDALVKGFKGGGTAQDPLLIQTVEDLMDLSRTEVGLKGYYFRQTADIDCTALSFWSNISFKGHYDGDGYLIKYKLSQNGGCISLFNIIQDQSSITKLKLENLSLSLTIEGSYIAHCFSNFHLINKANNCAIASCQSGYNLIGTASNCKITTCQAGTSLVGNTASNCTITACQSGASLIYAVATNCTITNCLVVINLTGSLNEDRGGIALHLTKDSVVERCFITGRCEYQGNGSFYFSGIASSCEHSIIRQCALGRLERRLHRVMLSHVVQQIKSYVTLENNISIESNSDKDGINNDASLMTLSLMLQSGLDKRSNFKSNNGTAVAAALFKQRYFENTLGWDFDTVWQ